MATGFLSLLDKKEQESMEDMRALSVISRRNSSLKEQYLSLQASIDQLEEKKARLSKEVQALNQECTDVNKRVQNLKREEGSLLESCSRIRASMVPSTKAKSKSRNTQTATLGKRLGKGALAAVYEAEVDGWTCACKVVPLDVSSEHDVTTFEKEMTLLCQLPPHPNIVRYLFHTRGQNCLNLYMSKYSGTLRQELTTLRQANALMDVEVAERFALWLTRGLFYLHSNSFLHRDLKSENVFVQHNYLGEVTQIAIGDFDQCIQIGVGTQRPTEIAGTTGFIAPEVLVASAERPYSFHSDIFSLGMVFFELVNVDLPYQELAPNEIYDAVLQGIGPVWKESASNQHAFLKKVSKMCTKFIPQERPSIAIVGGLLEERCELYMPPPNSVSPPKLSKSRDHTLSRLIKAGSGSSKKHHKTSRTLSKASFKKAGSFSDAKMLMRNSSSKEFEGVHPLSSPPISPHFTTSSEEDFYSNSSCSRISPPKHTSEAYFEDAYSPKRPTTPPPPASPAMTRKKTKKVSTTTKKKKKKKKKAETETGQNNIEHPTMIRKRSISNAAQLQEFFKAFE